MPSNEAAWLDALGSSLDVRAAPYPSPSPHDIVIRNGAVAINPTDWYQREHKLFDLQFPVILGHDTAGTVVEVGSAVTRFKVGDRVLALGESNSFQRYVLAPEVLVSRIPNTMSYEDACVIPLCYCTAASGLYQKDFLALQHPSVHPKPTGKVLIIWAASTSVGSNGVQLGVASGYEVFATSSSHNFDYVKKLGASKVFDYNSETVVEDMVQALKEKTVAGVLDCFVLNGAVEKCAEVLRRSDGTVKFIATAQPTTTELEGGVKTKFIWGSSLRDNEVGKAVFEDYLPHALEAGTFVPYPEAEVIGNGLEAIEIGMDTLKKGVSAKKIVVSLSPS